MAKEMNGLDLLKSKFDTVYVLEKEGKSKIAIFTNASEVKSDIEILVKFSKNVNNYCRHKLSTNEHDGTKYISIDECKIAFIGVSTKGDILKLENIATDNSIKALVNSQRNVLLLFPNEVDDNTALERCGLSPTGLVVIKCLLVATSICFGIDINNLHMVEKCINIVPQHINLDTTEIYNKIPNPKVSYYIIVISHSVIESIYKFGSKQSREKTLNVMFPDNYLKNNGYVPYLASGSPNSIKYEPGQTLAGLVRPIPLNAKKYYFE